MIYEILEFWLCSSYDEKDKNSFIKSINNIEMSKLSEPKTINKKKIKMETNKKNNKNETELKTVTEILNPKESIKWDRHTSVNPTAIARWFLGDSEQDSLL